MVKKIWRIKHAAWNPGQILVIQGDYDQALSLIKDAAKFNKTHRIKLPGLSAKQLRKLDHAKGR